MACPGGGSPEKLNLNGHKFNFEHRVSGNDTSASGRFSHYLRWRPDDKVSFSFNPNPNQSANVRIEVNSGGFFGWAGDFLGDMLGAADRTTEIRQAASLMAENARGKGWKAQAGVVIALVVGYWRPNGQSELCRGLPAGKKFAGDSSDFVGDGVGADSDADAEEALYESGELVYEGDEEDLEDEEDAPSCEDTGAC